MHTGGSVVDRLKINAVNPDALGAIKHAPAADTSGVSPPAAAAGGSAANIGVVTPAPGASFEAPRPEVHTAPAVAPTAAPPTAADNGANRRSSTTLGVQTAPQSTPTFAPLAHPFPQSGLPSEPASKPAPAPTQSAPASNAPGAGNTVRAAFRGSSSHSRRARIGATLSAPTLSGHDAVHLHHRRRGLLPRQGPGVGGARRPAAGARLSCAAAQARPLSERRSRHDEPLPARGGVRDRRRGGDRPRPRPLRALHRRVRQPSATTSPRARSTRPSSRRSGAATISAPPSR